MLRRQVSNENTPPQSPKPSPRMNLRGKSMVSWLFHVISHLLDLRTFTLTPFPCHEMNGNLVGCGLANALDL